MMALSRKRRHRGLRVLVSLLFAGMAMAALWEGVRELSLEVKSYGWETTQGQVRRVATHRASRNVHFAYAVGGTQYSASQKLMVMPFLEVPAVGDIVAVHYDPQRPDKALLSRGVRADGGIPLVISSLAIVTLLVGVVLANRRGLPAPSTTPERDGVTQRSHAEVVSAIEQRLASPRLFERWAGERWSELEQIGALGIPPLKTAFASRCWRGGLNVYGLLYARKHFVDMAHYTLFVWYTSSIQHFVAEGAEVELADWFVPGKREDQIGAVEAFLRGLQAPSGHQETRRIVTSWNLPNAFDWLNHLTYQAAWIRWRDDKVEMTAVCREGSFSFFSLRV